MPAARTKDTIPQPIVMDAPLPTLSIISPTPRTFSFALEHNLTADSPYSSRSNSPFEPDLRPLAFSSSCITPPPVTRTLSPPPSLNSSSSSPTSTNKRRKSSSTDVERRPKKGDDDYIKRPENAFILFRRKCCEDRQAAQEEAAAISDGPAKKQRQADLSKTISQQWKSLSAEERQHWEQLAKEKKKEHEQLYPNYVYRPQRIRDKDGRLIKKKNKSARGEFDHDTDSEQLSFVIPMVPPRHHGRSASAPTPPLPYHTIQVPNVYQGTPSCPTSPSLLPMISRRSAHPGHPEEVMSDFDYMPNDTLMPQSFGQAGFEANLQSSEFLRDMFNMPDNSQRLPPIDVSGEHTTLLPAHQILSPASSIGSNSSGPPSPSSGPFTPTSSMLPHTFSHLTTSNSHYQPSSPTEENLQMGLEVQLQHEHHELSQYNPYTWGQSSSLWPAGSEIIIDGDDFDLNAIPAIELGMPKYHDELQMGGDTSDTPYASAEYMYQNQHLDENLMAYNEMMSGGQSY